MSLRDTKVRILVLGVGGAGCNALDRVAMDGLPPTSPGEQPETGIPQLVAINTDLQALSNSLCGEKFQLGLKTTFGLGAGGDPIVGRKAAMEDRDRLAEMLRGADLVFVAAGLGGGTGGGAGPFIAQLAREAGALTLGFVTLPFEFEGERRCEQATAALGEFKRATDAVVCVPNDKLFEMAGERATVLDVFRTADDLLAEGVRALWRMLTKPGLINRDFNDLRRALEKRHDEIVFAFGTGEGDDKAMAAATAVTSNPLLGGGAILAEAETVLVSLRGGLELTMTEVKRVVSQVSQQCVQKPHVLVAASVDENFAGKLSVLLIASRARSATVEAALASPLPSDREMAASMKDKVAGGDAAMLTTAGKPGQRPEQAAEKAVGKRPGGDANRLRQQRLALEINVKGRFDKVEPTIYEGEDLDLPTFLRRGIKIG
ncbi:MAG: cell division protein FtsZ [Verrucomicrobia bacterium]|nr:cell division protein FtsZ [Verrucomicrobiota bacterium]